MSLTSIIILTHNGLDMTRDCVDSIFRHTPEPFELIFVDNASTDGTVEYLKTVPQSRLICNDYNAGFAAGCNQGLLAAEGKYLLLLNNDTIVTKHWLGGLVERLEKQPELGAVGPVATHVAPIQCVYDYNGNNVADIDAYAAHRANTHHGQGFYSHKLIGFCMLIKREVLERVGGLDERFFPGNYEDDDLSLRIRIAGYALWVAQDVFIYHKGQGTFEHTAAQVGYRLTSMENAERFREKWNVGLSAFEIALRGYNPTDIVLRETIFIPERHCIPIMSVRQEEANTEPSAKTEDSAADQED